MPLTNPVHRELNLILQHKHMTRVSKGNGILQGMYVFYLELVTDMLHLLVYVIFFIIVFTNYGLPLHLVRSARPVTWHLYKFQRRAHASLASCPYLSSLCRIGAVYQYSKRGTSET